MAVEFPLECRFEGWQCVGRVLISCPECRCVGRVLVRYLSIEVLDFPRELSKGISRVMVMMNRPLTSVLVKAPMG